MRERLNMYIINECLSHFLKMELFFEMEDLDDFVSFFST